MGILRPQSFVRSAEARRTRFRTRIPGLCCVIVALSLLVTLLPVAAFPSRVPSARAQTSEADDAPPVETDIDDLQDPSIRTEENPDGSFTTEFFSEPVQYAAPDGSWLPIDSSLVATSEDGFDYTNAAASTDILFNETADGTLLQVEDPEATFSISLDGAAASKAVTDGAAITYEDVFPGVDLRYDVSSGELKETLVLDGDSQTDFTFTLTQPAHESLDAQLAPDGSWEFTSDSSDGPAFSLPAPLVVDSAEDPAVGPASLSVEPKGETFVLGLSVDPTWLKDPSRVYPVLLDPTIILQDPDESADDFQFNVANNTITTPNFINVGSNATGKFRGAFRFPDLSGIPTGATIATATLRLFWRGDCVMGPSGCGTHTLDARKITSSWTTNSNPSNITSTALSSYSLTPTTQAPNTFTWDVKSAVTGWISNPSTNHGLLVKRSSDTSFNLNGPQVVGRRTTGDPTLQPALEVTWTSPASTLFEPQVVRSSGAELAWSRHAPGSTFLSYEIHRKPGSVTFTPSATSLIATIGDPDVTTYADTTAAADATFTYRVVTVTGSVASPQKDPSNRQVVATPAFDANGREQTTAVLQPGPADGKATQLTYFDNPSQNPPDMCTNNGTGTRLRVGTSLTNKYRSIVWFDLRRIPADAIVSVAKLQLYHEGTTASFNVDVHRVTTPWAEGTGSGSCTGDGATWNEARAGLRWNAAGGDHGPQIATLVGVNRTLAAWDTFDLMNPSDVFSPWIRAEEPNFGFIIKRETETLQSGQTFSYWSDDVTFAPTIRPKLEITYADPGASSSARPSANITFPLENATVSGDAEGVQMVRAVAADDSRVDHVEFFVDGAGIGVDSAAPYEMGFPTVEYTNGPHELSVQATDDAGQTGGTTLRGEIDITLDTASPTVAMTAPADGALVSGTLTVSATATDNLGVSKVEFFFDGILIGSDTTSQYSVPWDTKAAAAPAYYGDHTITARVTSTSGQITVSAPRTVTVNNSGTYGAKYEGAVRENATGKPPEKAIKDPELDPDDIDPTFPYTANGTGTGGPLNKKPIDATLPPGQGGRARHPHPGKTPESYAVSVDVFNDSNLAWGSSDHRLWYRWLDGEGLVVYEAPFGTAQTFLANSTTPVTATVTPPGFQNGVEAAAYRLVFDIHYNDGTTDGIWFSARGVGPIDHPVHVTRDLATNLGLEHFWHYEGEPVGAGMTHLTNVSNGNSILQWTPFSSPGRGLATVLNLTYNSLEEHSRSPLGNNFSLSISSLTRFGEPLDLHANNGANAYVALTDGDGTTHRFEESGNGDWTEPPGVNLYLRELVTGEWALTRPDGVTFYFNAEGFPTKVQDLNGNKITFTLEQTPPAEDPGGPKYRITEVIDAAGNDVPASPNRKYLIDYYSKAESTDAQVRGNIERITDHTGNALVFAYFPDGNLKTMTQEGGDNADGSFLPSRTFTFSYTANASSTEVTNPTAPQSSRLYSVTDPRGNKTTFDYLFPGAEDPGTPAQLRYRLESRTNRDGDVTTSSYDIALPQKTTVTAPENRITTFTYDTDGKVTAIARRLDAQTTETTNLQWSSDFAVTKIIEPSGEFVEYAYNGNGYPIDIWDQQRSNTHLVYEQSCATGETGSCSHVSHVITKTDPRASVWTFDYFRPQYNLKSVADPLGNTTNYAWDLSKGTLTSVTDPRGPTYRTDFLDYEASGQPTRVVNTKENIETRFGFDDDGLLLWIQDPNHVGYSGGDPTDYRNQFYYDSFSRLGASSTPKSSAYELGVHIWTVMTYDANDNVIETYGPRYSDGLALGSKTTSVFDKMDRADLVTGPENDKTDSVYDNAGRLIKITMPEGFLTGSETRDRTVEYTYDAFDRVSKTTRYDNPGGTPRTLNTHNCYQALTGDLIAVVPPKGDGASPCDPANQFETRYEYFPDHTLKKTIGPPTPSVPVGATKTYAYNENNNVLSITDAEGDVETRTYDRRNLLKTVVEPFDVSKTIRTAFQYDAVGNRVLVASPRAVDTTPTHFATLLSDPNASPYQPTDPYVVSYTFDGANRRVREQLPTAPGTSAAYVHQEYDKVGNLISVSLPVTAASIGALGNDYDWMRTKLTYLDPGWIRSSHNQVTPRVVFDYTAEGWQRSRAPVNPLGGLDLSHQMLWQHSPDGMVVARADREGGLSGYTYDLDNLVTGAFDSSGVSDSTEKVLDMVAAYDWLGRSTTVKNRKGTSGSYRETTYSYDTNGNLIERTQDKLEGSGTDLGRKGVFTYDPANVLDTQTISGTDQASCSDDRLVNNDFTPVGLEKLREMFRGSGAPGACSFTAKKQATSWQYFANGKLKVLETKNGAGTTLESHTVSYVEGTAPNPIIYLNGHRVADTFVLKNPDISGTDCQPGGPGCPAKYTYDARDRLIEVYDGHGGRTKYTFDEECTGGNNCLDPSYTAYGVWPTPTRAGNVTTERTYTGATPTTDGTLQTTERSAFRSNQLKGVAVNGLAVTEYHYDPNGNLDCLTTAPGSPATCPESLDETGTNHNAALLADYAYDGLDRLVAYRSWSGPTLQNSASYTYDPLDRTVRELEIHGTSPQTTTTFSYLGLTTNVASETSQGSSGRVKTYAYDANGVRITMTDDTDANPPEDFTYGYDVHGSVSLLVNDSGGVKASYGYTPYGTEDKGLTTDSEQLTDGSGTPNNFAPINPFRYTAKRHDTGSATLDMGVRRFGPNTGTFLSSDLFMGALADVGLSSDPLSQNRYALAGGNPLSFIEWDGHKVTSDGGGTAKSMKDADDSQERPTLSPEAHREMNFVYGPVLDLNRIDDALDAAKEFGVDPYLLITLMIKEGELRQLCEPCSEEFEKYQVANFENPSIGIMQMQFETFKETTKKHLESFGGPGPNTQYGVFDEWRLAFTERLRDERTATRYAAAHLSDIRAQVRPEDRSDPAVLAGVYNAGIQRYWDYYVPTGSFQSGADNYVAAIRDPGGLYQEVRGMFD